MKKLLIGWVKPRRENCLHRKVNSELKSSLTLQVWKNPKFKYVVRVWLLPFFLRQEEESSGCCWPADPHWQTGDVPDKWTLSWTGTWPDHRFKGLWPQAQSPAGNQSLVVYSVGPILGLVLFNIFINNQSVLCLGTKRGFCYSLLRERERLNGQWDFWNKEAPSKEKL